MKALRLCDGLDARRLERLSHCLDKKVKSLYYLATVMPKGKAQFHRFPRFIADNGPPRNLSTRSNVKRLHFILDYSLPETGRGAFARVSSWTEVTSHGIARPVVLFQAMNLQHPGEGSS